jgi:hypothetical protein
VHFHATELNHHIILDNVEIIWSPQSYIRPTECRGAVHNTPVSLSISLGFETWSGERKSWGGRRLHGFLRSLQAHFRKNLTLGHHHFIPRCFQAFNHPTNWCCMTSKQRSPSIKTTIIGQNVLPNIPFLFRVLEFIIRQRFLKYVSEKMLKILSF